MDEKGELLSIHSHEPTLGDIFIEVTGRIIMTFSMRRFSAIFRKEVQDIKANASVLVMAALPLVFLLFINRWMDRKNTSLIW